MTAVDPAAGTPRGPGGGDVCSADHAGWLVTPLRRLLHDPGRILAGLIAPGRDGRRLRLRAGVLHPDDGRDGRAGRPGRGRRPADGDARAAAAARRTRRSCRPHSPAAVPCRSRRRAPARRLRADLLHGPRGARREPLPRRGRERAQSRRAAPARRAARPCLGVRLHGDRRERRGERPAAARHAPCQRRANDAFERF